MTQSEHSLTPPQIPQRDTRKDADAFLDLWEKNGSLVQRDGPPPTSDD